MKRLLSAALLLCLAVSPAWGASLKIPSEVKAPAGDWYVLQPETDCKGITFIGLDDLKPLPSAVVKDPRWMVVSVPASGGRWRFTAVGTLDDQQVRVDFVVTSGDAPPGPGPGPGPGPTPPTDAFTKSVQDAYAAETDPARAAQAAWLAAIYRNAGTLLDDPAAATAGGLFGKLQAAIHNPGTGIPAGSLAKVSKVIGADLNVTLGGTAAGIDPNKAVDRAAAKAAFARYAAALSTLRGG